MPDEKKEHPIIFTGLMVQAIMENKKTMTRRMLKPQPLRHDDIIKMPINLEDYSKEIKKWSKKGYRVIYTDGILSGMIGPKVKYNVGDLLWVRESFNIELYPVAPEGDKDELLYYYKATEKEFTDMRWKPSIHMPKSAARIWLEITDLKIERLQSISEEDILSEGVRYHVSQDNHVLFEIGDNRAWDFMPEQWKIDRYVENRGKEKHVTTEKEIMFAHWAELWCSINGRESWETNPWVLALSFKRTSNE